MPKKPFRPRPGNMTELRSLLGYDQSINAERGPGARRLSDLDAIRVTSMAAAERCPKEWQVKNLVLSGTGDPGRESQSAQLGTWAHEVIESFMRSGRAQLRPDDVRQRLLRQGMSANEVDNLFVYCETLRPHLGQVVGIERELSAQVPHVRPVLRGHVDLIIELGPGHLLVIDHKTNRRPNTVEWWQAQLQPLAYAYLARRWRPDVSVVTLQIGYGNLGTTRRWDSLPVDDARLEDRLRLLWAQLEAAEQTGIWPRVLNAGCRWCPEASGCSRLKNEGASFIESLGLTDLTR